MPPEAALSQDLPNSNGPSQAEQEEILNILQEEASEVISAIAKIKRFGFESRNPATGETNRQALERELGDLRTAAALALQRDIVNLDEIRDHSKAKIDKIQPYLMHTTITSEDRNRVWNLHL